MKTKEFSYMLRFAVQPGHHEYDRLGRMAEFCVKACIDDVMFFIDCEELNRGYLTREETKPWMEVIARGRDLIKPLGITASINPWPTLLHGDRGRGLREDQKFNLMTDPYGNRTTAVACPLCPEWRTYIADIYACYAEIHPNILWVEDDFRLHNHGPLTWGGCFCELHMAEYSRRAGRKITREEFVKGVLIPGKPHPYRKIWLDVSRDTMLENSALIGEAVHKISPHTRVGLMSSDPSVHCAEGRDWAGILKGFSGGEPMVNRPTLPAYNECTAQEYLKGVASLSKLTCSVIPGETEIYPELESFPHSRFSKSKTFTRFQLESSAALGADGITLNIFDMMGNGIIMSEGYQDVLACNKDFLTGIKGLGLKLQYQEGIKVLYSPLSSYTVHTTAGTNMKELYPSEHFWAQFLSCMSISNTYSLDIDHKNEIVAVSGQFFRNLTKRQIYDLFENNFVMLEGEATQTLFDMGYGELAGMADLKWHLMDSGFQSYEQTVNKKAYCGIEEARISSQAVAGDFLEIGYSGKAEWITAVKSPEGQTVAPGLVMHDKKVLIFPYGKFKGFQSHLTPVRQSMLQDAIASLEQVKKPLFVAGEPDIAVNLYKKGAEEIIMLINYSNDPVNELRLYMPVKGAGSIMEINRLGKPQVLAKARRDGDYIVLGDGIGALEVKVLKYNT